MTYRTICFDHQATRKLTGKFEGTNDRLAIVWHSNETHNAIGMIEMPDKTAESQSLAIRTNCDTFGIEDEQVVGVTCDNAATNVGIRRGTCVLLEHALNKSLLRLMCRHHILEIVIKDVYHHLFSSDTPNNLFFPLLKERWADLREQDFPFTPFNPYSFIGDIDFGTHDQFESLKNRALIELRAHSRNGNIRDDYREVTLLALKFFGEVQIITKGNQVKFRTLINPSNARFMATIIQGLECYLFRESFDWDADSVMQRNLMRFCAFASLIYIRYWNRCSILFDAPRNDLNFLQELQEYKLFDEAVANIAIAAFNRHLHYLGEELAPLSLFSEKVSNQEKNDIAEKLVATFDKIMPPRGLNASNSNHIAYNDGNHDQNHDWRAKSVADFIGNRSLFFFEVMNLPRNFLRSDANGWKRNREYISAKRNIKRALICINDASERVISNCKNKFSKQRCRKESTFRQNMLSLNIIS